MRIHSLKLRWNYCEDVLGGLKTFEIRKNDRDFKVGDLINFKCIHNYHSEAQITEMPHPIDKEVYRITYVLTELILDFGLQEGYCILGIKKLS